MADRIDLIVRNATLVTPSGRREADVAIANGRFVAIAARGELLLAADQELDASGLFALAGVIDGHVHFRQPGLEHKEDWLTGTRAAVMGGVTTVLDMPNTIPPTDTVDHAREKLALAAASAYCDFGIFGLVGRETAPAEELISSGLVVGLKVFLGPTTGGLSAPSDDDLSRVLELAAKSGLRVAFHAEDEQIIRRAEEKMRRAGRSDALAHLETRPIEAEVAAVEHAGRLLHESGAGGHIVHLSSAQGLATVERWRAQGVDMTAEATAHHCFLDADAYAKSGSLVRINPPARGQPHAAALLAALAGGQIDCVASDHSPHTADEKHQLDIWSVPSGFAGVETILPLFLTHAVHAGRLSLERLAYLTSEGPARTWSLWPRKGAVQVGSDADLTLIDLERPGVIRAADLHGKNNLTPFEGWATRGVPVATIIRGRVVMRDGELLGEPGWGRSTSS